MVMTSLARQSCKQTKAGSYCVLWSGWLPSPSHLQAFKTCPAAESRQHTEASMFVEEESIKYKLLV